MSDFGQAPAPQDLQFEHAEPLTPEDPNAQRCVVCKQPIGASYFHASGQIVCPMCAERVQSGQQKPPAIALGRAFLYGLGAAFAGCVLYAAVAILLNLEIGIVAIAVGIIVGKAVRAGARGLGGRPQQILAVVLTYFSITTSYIPVFFYQYSKNPHMFDEAKKKNAEKKAATPDAPQSSEVSDADAKPKMGFVGAMLFLLLLFAAAPFLNLASGVGGLISLFIIFIGLKQAWRLTARPDILVMGPYETHPQASAQ
jgi:hypothetical protein